MPDVVRLVAAVWDLWPVTEEGFRHRLASLPARARPRRFVGLRGGEVVGWAPSVFSFEGERTDTAYFSVTVREDVRGQGLGARVDAEAAADIPQDEPISNMPFDEWLEQHWRHPLLSLDGSIAARRDGRVVAVTLLRVDPERGRAGNDMTGTLRAYRGRGLARLLKLCQAEWAARNGITRILTENDETNRPMLAVNERLGFRPVASVYSYARDPL